MDNLSYDKKRPTFGTGGIRAVMGFGSECFNAGLVRAATIGAARWANEKYGDDAMKLGFVVCCDTRNHSTAYAHLCADVLSIAGFRSRIFKQPTPTPLLSYAIRRFGACAGIAITASHNAAAYNGFKVYDATGNQLTPDDTALIARKTDDFLLDGVDRLPQRIYSEVTVIGPSLLEEYISKVIASFPAATNPEKLRIVYTPLFGAGRLAVSKILTSAGFSDLLL
ncbi:MAG: hypothetical protein RRY38_01440, partial [Oscillospiraceae bacterium]